MAQLTKPDFHHSIVNLSATVAEFLGCPNDKPTLPAVASALGGGYKNVVLMILDGLGTHPLRTALPEGSFLRRHVADTLTSVFPSTTTNATTSLQSAAYPMEHGWFGWSLYFEELRRSVDLFPECDSLTGEEIERGYVRRTLPVTPFYRRATGGYTPNVVVPPFWIEEENRYVWEDVDGFFLRIGEVCKKAGKQFVYAYCTQPDSVMHRTGVSSAETREVIGALQTGIEKLVSELSDTLLIVTADHGQIDVGGSFDLYADGDLLPLLQWPPYLEARAPAFKVKPGCRREFEAAFGEKYGADFRLFETPQLIEENFFGGDPVAAHVRLLGDYIAAGTTDKIMKLTPRGHVFKGHHTSLTAEMTVPLLLLPCGR